MALIQSTAVGNSTLGANLVLTLNGVVAGSLLTLEVGFAQQTNSAAPTIAGWTTAQNPVGQVITLGVAWSGSCIFYKENAAAGTHTATIVPGGSVAVMSAIASEWVSGLASGSLDKSTNAANAAGTTGGSGTTAATANAGELVVVAYGFLDNTGTPHANCGVSSPATTGYTALGVNQDNTTTGTAFQASYKYVTSTGTQVAAWTYTDASAGVGTIATFKLAPRIDTQPVSQSVFSGQTATFTIAATTSGGTLHYQWKFDGANVGSDSNSYARSLCVAADSGKTVSCDVTDDNGTTSSATVNLYVDVNKMFYLLA